MSVDDEHSRFQLDSSQSAGSAIYSAKTKYSFLFVDYSVFVDSAGQTRRFSE